jgi:adenylosuccinate synthase
VGEGPFPVEQLNDIGDQLREQGAEFGATTGRPRRCGWFDAVAVGHANRINGFTGIALTKLDVLTGIKTLKVCRSYKIDGKEVTAFPAGLPALERSEPIYEELDGWDQDLSAVRSYADLPENAQRYIQLIRDLIGVEVCLIAVGVEREETIMLKNPFAA